MTEQEKQAIFEAFQRGNDMMQEIEENRRASGEIGYRLTVDLFVAKCNSYGIAVSGGTIHDYLKNCHVKYYGGKCPVWHIVYTHTNGQTVGIGNNVYTKSKYNPNDNKPKLQPLEMIDCV